MYRLETKKLMDVPRLVEPTTFSYMRIVLQKCHEHRIRIYSILFNCLVLTVFVSIFGFGLYYSRCKKLSPFEQQMKLEKSKQYVLSKIREYQQESLKDWSITNLPNTYMPVAQQL